MTSSKDPFTVNTSKQYPVDPGSMSLETLKNNVLQTIYNVFKKTKDGDLLKLRSTLDLGTQQDWTTFQENCNGHLLTMLSQPENDININNLSQFTDLTTHVENLWEKRKIDPNPEPIKQEIKATPKITPTVPCLEESSQEVAQDYKNTILVILKQAEKNYLTDLESKALVPVITRMENISDEQWVFIFHGSNDTLDDIFAGTSPINQERIEQLQTLFTQKDTKQTGAFNNASSTLQELILMGAAHLSIDKENTTLMAQKYNK